MTTYEIRTTITGTTYPGCERRDATCASLAEAEAAVASLIATGEWDADDLEIVEIVLSPEQVAAALAAGAEPLHSGSRLGVTYGGEDDDEDMADAACDEIVAAIAAATGAVVTVVDSGPDAPGYWSVLAFDGRACDPRGMAV